MVTLINFGNSPPSIRRQLLIFIVAAVVLLFLFFGIATSWLMGNQISVLIVNNAQQVSRALAQQSTLALLTESYENAQPALEQVMTFPDVVGTGLITRKGTLLGWQGETEGESYFSALNWGKIKDPIIVDEDNRYWYVASVVILASNNPGNESETSLFEASEQRLGYALVAFSKQRLNATNRSIALAVAVAGALAVAALIFIVGSAIRRLLSPLQSLSEIMIHNHATGQHKLANVQGSKEIQRMAESFNAMMNTLDEQDERLRSHRDQLEAEVKIQTRELVEARDAALTSNRHKSEFLANVTHELRSPIQSIIGYVELVKEEVENEGLIDIKTDLDKVSRNSERLYNLINSLLDLSKIEAGKMELKVKSMYLSDLLINLEEATAPLLPTNNNQYHAQINCKDMLVRMDGEKVLQILINLLSNACKFTQNGDISLTVSLSEQMLRFDVADTGIGIPEEQLHNIFQAFRQIDAGESRKFSGTGLGLAISKQFSDLMQAKLSVRSKLNEGSCFSFILPLRQ
jgi:two-component system, NarL family, sensor histidine kinase BarA